MQNDEWTTRPPYAVDAVDNALRLLTILWRDGAVRVNAVADELGVARSTAHRLLRMLVFRGFAVQRADRAYVPGPALARSVPRADHTFLRGWLRPAIEEVHRALDETVHLVVRDGDQVVFLDSIEARQPLRVGSRVGMRLPAETTSGGKALLAHLPAAAVHALYHDRPAAELARLGRMLARTRQQRYGLNVDGTEPGVAAVGVSVPDGGGEPFAALSVSAPTMRFRRAQAPAIAEILHAAADKAAAGWA